MSDNCPTCRARDAIMQLFPQMLREGEDVGPWITGAAQGLGRIVGMYCDEAQLGQFIAILGHGYTDGAIARANIEARGATRQ